MSKPGRLVQLSDGRKAIVYNVQPLIKSHKKVVLHLVGDDHNLILNEDEKPKKIMMDLEKWELEVEEKTIKLIGYVD